MTVIKKLFYLSIFIYSLFFVFIARAVSYPVSTGFVNDYADLYSVTFRTDLEKKLLEVEETSGAELAVVTVNSLEGESVEDYAVRLFEKWRIGKEKTDNGLLLLLVKEDREVRIEVGYGLEPYITDGRSGDIIRRDIIPEFKNGNYEAGTEKAVNSLIKYITEKDIASRESVKKDSDFPFWAFLVGFYFLATYLVSFLGRTKEIWPGAALGGILGLVIGIIALSIIAAIFLAVFAGLFGLFLDYILSRNYKIRKEKGLPTGFWTSGGGFRSSGGGSSFGGFGGGSSGGGGASGRW